jgi:hypothetical protein
MVMLSNINLQYPNPYAPHPSPAAAGYSLVYLLAGGGLGGAVLIFIVAKLLGK